MLSATASVARNRWKQEHNGLTLRSGFEKRVATFLDENKVKYEYETIKLPFVEPATNRTYRPDFILPNGIYIECKGRFTPDDRRKIALIIEQYPDLDLRLVFMRNNTLSKNSRTTYTDWCDARGIKSHVCSSGTIPKEWLKKQTKKDKNNNE